MTTTSDRPAAVPPKRDPDRVGAGSRRSRDSAARKSPRPVGELSPNARVVLERRYLAKDDSGKPIETPEEMFARVAHNVAQAELLYKPLGDPQDVALWEERFYNLMASL
ncbi:MAG: ribonucleotide reductase N-terminal alpha domain-containing protein, partial [Longimicrobiales bacterium]|nr:ribonucleotide reductase N-terminal alpha domain-containing protein [Longimicrobiales bacterium]